MLQPQIESCGWHSSSMRQVSRKIRAGSCRACEATPPTPSKLAQALNGSAHFSNSDWQAWLRCLIHMRDDNTLGKRGERLELRSSPLTIGIGRFPAWILDCTAAK